MRIAYVTMQFPVWPEAFAVNDISTLYRKGVELSVHSLRNRHNSGPALIREHELEDLPMSWFGPGTVLRFPWLLVRRFPVLRFLLTTVIRHNWRSPSHLAKGLSSIPRTLEIVDHFLNEPPDTVHLFWGHYPALAGLAVRRFLPQTSLTLFLGAYDLLWGYGCTPPAARAADAVFTHAESNRPAIEDFGVESDRVRVIYRGVNLKRWQKEKNREKRPFSIATAGKLVAEKRFHEVIDVAATLLREFPDLTLTILGDGSERERLTERVRRLGLGKRIHFTGAVPHRRVFSELGRADLFLFLSAKPSERLPNVVKEAIACRCVVVTSRTEGIEELIPDDSHGRVVDSPEQAIREIRRLWSSDEIREKIRRNAGKHLAERFNLERTMQEYLDIWKELRNELSGSAGKNVVSGSGTVPDGENKDGESAAPARETDSSDKTASEIQGTDDEEIDSR